MHLLIDGKSVRDYREQLAGHPSQRVFAKRVGISYVTLSRIEKGRVGASKEMIEKLAKGLGVPAGNIIRLGEYETVKVTFLFEKSVFNKLHRLAENTERPFENHLGFILKEYAEGRLISATAQAPRKKMGRASVSKPGQSDSGDAVNQ